MIVFNLPATMNAAAGRHFVIAKDHDQTRLAALAIVGQLQLAAQTLGADHVLAAAAVDADAQGKTVAEILEGYRVNMVTQAAKVNGARLAGIIGTREHYNAVDGQPLSVKARDRLTAAEAAILADRATLDAVNAGTYSAWNIVAVSAVAGPAGKRINGLVPQVEKLHAFLNDPARDPAILGDELRRILEKGKSWSALTITATA